MIYLKEPNTNRITKFDNEDSIGVGFADWIELTENESLAYELQKAKDTKLSQLKTNKDTSLSAPFAFTIGLQNVNFVFNDKTKHDFYSRVLKLKCLITDLITNPTAEWTDANNTTHELTFTQFQSLLNHMNERDQTLHKLYFEKKIEINNCTTIEEVDAVDISFS